MPVTVKCRLGVDEQDPEIALDALADAVIAAGADALLVHARKAWLQGLSPEGEPRGPAARLRPRLPAEGAPARASSSASMAASPRSTRPRRISPMSTASCSAAPPTTRRTSSPRSTAASSATRRPTPDLRDVVEAMVPYVESVLAAGGRAVACHAAHARPVPRPAGRAAVAAHPVGRRGAAGRRRRRGPRMRSRRWTRRSRHPAEPGAGSGIAAPSRQGVSTIRSPEMA